MEMKEHIRQLVIAHGGIFATGELQPGIVWAEGFESINQVVEFVKALPADMSTDIQSRPSQWDTYDVKIYLGFEQ